ncbi:MAG: molybdate ABC transporter substrate-binding protein [Chloroflexi bacterium HGW-Chloroflexi-4]|jgi:molybdenum ABC transporter molybdate-binding protein|nr:MAG: molybdate ABC transporter substrate-binding protein [Chloroflexi bacterium HGW-Chloroflexi-4]
MRIKIITILVAFIFLATSACAPLATVVPTSIAGNTSESTTLTVLAAASLTESFTELGAIFESQNSGVEIAFNFAGSQSLSEQLDQGAQADVFASASMKYMTAAVDTNRINENEVKNFTSNRLVVIFPKNNPAGITSLADLAKPGIKIDLADKAVPVGQYALDFLNKTVANPSFDENYKDNVLANVVSYEENVKAVVTKIALGEADAGIVYLTDIIADAVDKIGSLEIPTDLNTVATYPIAQISDSKNSELAKAFVAFVLSSEGQDVLAKYHFIPAAGFTVTDALERTVTFEKAPERIVLVGKALFMVADAIYLFPEAGESIVAIGTTNQSTGDFIPIIDANYDTKTILDGSAGAEQIAAEQPDLVIMKSMNAEKLGAPIEALGIPVLYLDFETADQYQRDLKTLGQLFQNPTKAEELAAWYKGKVDAVTSTISGLTDEQKPRTLLLYYSDKDGTIAFNVPPMGWMQTYLIQTAGGTPVWEDANPGNGWTTVNLEQIAAWNPEVVFVVSYFVPINDVVTQMKADPQWMLLDAVKNGKLYGFATDVYSWDQPDTRWALGLDWVASKLHPDLFPDYDASAEAREFYKSLYGMDEAAFESNILPLFKGDIN